jgi:hypothetical protein
MLKSQDILWEEDPKVFIFHEDTNGKTRMHIKALDLKNWILIDKTYPDHMAMRFKLIEEKLPEVFVSTELPSTKLAKEEVLELLIDYLPKRYPTFFQSTKDGGIKNLLTGDQFNPKNLDEDPLIVASRLVQEDFCILELNPETSLYKLTAGIVLFPMRWKLTEKFKNDLPHIHIPVTAFTKHLKNNVNDLFEDMQSNAPVWRANWSLFHDLDGPLDLFSPASTSERAARVISSENLDEVGRIITFRAEFQTLRRLPKSNAILFGIRTYQRYLEDFKTLPKSDTIALIKAIENLSAEMYDYKSAKYWKDASLKYLRSISQTASL